MSAAVGSLRPVDRVLEGLDGVKRSGSGWLARCPAHDDQNPSLSVSEGDEGQAVMTCFAGCTFEEILAAVDLRTDEAFREPTVYPYTDEGGGPLFDVLRFSKKRFTARRPDGMGGWTSGLGDTRRVLYRLPEVTQAVGEGRTVFVVEGEKDVEAVRGLLLVATTSPFGAGNWKPEYGDYLLNAHVVVIPDNDEAGRSHARDVVASVVGKAATIKLLEVPGLPEKGDISDWIEAGGTKSALEELVQGAARYEPRAASNPPPSTSYGLNLLSIRDLRKRPAEKIEWLVKNFLPAGGASVFASSPKVGKSTITRQLVASVRLGTEFLGYETRRGTVVYVGIQEQRDEVRRHFDLLGVPDDDQLLIHTGGVRGDAPELLKDLLRERRPALLIIDTLIAFFPISDLNDYSKVAAVLEPVLDLGRETGTHIALVHHAKKKGVGPEAILGSTAILGMVDTAVLMREAQDHTRIISSVQRYGVSMPETILTFDSEIGRSDIGLRRDEHDEARIAGNILVLLQDAETPMTEQEIDDKVEGNTSVKRKALRSLVNTSRVLRTGGGRRGNPYRYQALSRGVPFTPTN